MRSAVPKSQKWLEIIFRYSGLLDILLFGWITVIFPMILTLEAGRGVFHGLTIIADLILVISFLASGGGIFFAQRWAAILYYVQFPFRLFFMKFSFGFLGGLMILFPGQWAYYFILAVIVLLELGRLWITIQWTKAIKKWTDPV